ncbi:MAG: hypothetical protein ACLR0U_32505 [Enterocloster clostridioformis]
MKIKKAAETSNRCLPAVPSRKRRTAGEIVHEAHRSARSQEAPDYSGELTAAALKQLPQQPWCCPAMNATTPLRIINGRFGSGIWWLRPRKPLPRGKEASAGTENFGDGVLRYTKDGAAYPGRQGQGGMRYQSCEMGSPLYRSTAILCGY